MLVDRATAASIGQISDFKGSGEVVRNKDKFVGKLSLPIEQMDNVQTGNGRIEIKFVDDSTVKLTEQSKLVIDEFVYDGKPSNSKMALKFAAGTARFATGQTGKINKANIALSTPSATVAVRGTDFASTVDDFGKSLFILLPEEDGSVGEITVSNAAGSVILNRAFQATMVDTFDSKPSQPVILNLSLNQIDNMLIVSPPKPADKEDEEEDRRTNILDLSELDVDFLAFNGLEEDNLANSDLAINTIDTNFLAEDPLEDPLAGNGGCSTKENVKLCGTAYALDSTTQFTTILSGDYIRMVRSLNTTVDVKLKSESSKNLYIDSNGKSFSIKVNDAEAAGATNIIINQSN
jgi:hypothetical protein